MTNDATTPGPDPETRPRLVDPEPVTTAVVRGTVAPAELRGFFDGAFGALGRVLHEQEIAPESAAFGLYRGATGEKLDLEVGFAVGREVRGEDGVVPGRLPGGRVARVTHRGGFDGLGAAWESLAGWIREQGLRPGELRWEVYVTRPTPDMDPRDLRTELNWTLAD
ncbi:GyrI-like domain-containing protein [Streptomyces sp. SKN60]|uniref:GyrI-like domain-containing protein n=1 Tax=Streptomyces sp. SKN60 TaxID=2855506 RepID=UPI002245048F|nr:GyrI-like domain-containing protein [Streptomyces sp. SKN60]MCX2181443.1 GyrI-like domain-containing protein [Streptomyces sp. SKN60]